MNNGAQGQPTQGQSSGAQGSRPQATVQFRPEQMQQLPEPFTPSEKNKWEQGLKQLYSTMANNPKESQQWKDAERKLNDFSRTLHQKILAAKQGQQTGGVRPGSQGQLQNQGGDKNGANPNPAAQAPRLRITPKIQAHIDNFPFILPPHLAQGSVEGNKWLTDAKHRYTKGLMTMEQCTERLAAYDALKQKRIDEGKPLSPEEENDLNQKKEPFARQHAQAKHFVESFRQQQQAQTRAAQNSNQQGNSSQQGGSGNSNGGQTPVRPSMPGNPAMQNTQMVNQAIEAARNQQMGGARPGMQQNGQGGQGLNQSPASQNMPQNLGGQVQTIKQEAGVPHINTQMQGRPMQNNSPQSAVPQSAQSTGPQSATSAQPRALTHPQALQSAARTYSSGQTSGTPNVMGHSHTHPSAPRGEIGTQNVITNKMPIPKHLPERATAQPQPVGMPPSRPTFSGGPNNSSNILSQPILQKTPGYNMEGDGDRVLNKKKLDELVRQVTGGGEGLEGGQGLTPDVEEVRIRAFLCVALYRSTR